MAKTNRRKERARRAIQPDLNKNALWIAVVLAGIGAALAFYATQLTFSIESQGIVEASGCSINDFVNCDVANASSYAKMFGVPVAWFGFLFYLFAGLSALFGATSSSTRQPASFIAMALVLSIGAVLFTFVKAYHLYELGVEKEKAKAFLARSAGVFALPMLIEAFNIVIVQGLIKTIIFGTIAKIIGSQLAGRLFAFLVARMPWWVSWIGPAAWTLSLGWTAFDLQGPAKRKTIPVVLYLGLCSLREKHGVAPAEVATDAS